MTRLGLAGAAAAIVAAAGVAFIASRELRPRPMENLVATAAGAAEAGAPIYYQDPDESRFIR